MKLRKPLAQAVPVEKKWALYHEGVEFDPDFINSPFFENPDILRYHIGDSDLFYDKRKNRPIEIQLNALIARFEHFLQGRK